MRIAELLDGNSEIYDLQFELEKDRFVIRWRWPKEIDVVYILKINSTENFSVDNISENDVKLYTRDEYREFNGYCETIKDVNQYEYYIFPAILDKGEIILLKQNNSKNQITISTGKTEISYHVKEIKLFKSLFSKEKTLQIIIDSEVDLKKDVLCYVKKYGSNPINREDGISFDFIDNIPSGKSFMPEITVDKNEYVKVFIKDVNKYGVYYNLKQE